MHDESAVRPVELPVFPMMTATSATGPSPDYPAPRPTGERRGILRGMRVLLVEDHPDTLATYAEGLRRQGAEIMTATTAQMALLHVQRRPPHVLVVDIALPDVDGNEFLRNVRQLRPSPGWDTPAIALTAYNSLQDRLRTVNAGFRLHIAKPVDPTYLAGLIAELGRGRA